MLNPPYGRIFFWKFLRIRLPSEKQLIFLVNCHVSNVVSKPRSYRKAKASTNSTVPLFPNTATFTFHQVVKKFVTDHKSLFVEPDHSVSCTTLRLKKWGMLLFAALLHLLEPVVAYMPELSRINKQEAKIMHFYKYLNTIPEERGYKYGQYWL